jgi:hypothetical protein
MAVKLLEGWDSCRPVHGSGARYKTEDVGGASQVAKVRVAQEAKETTGCSTTVFMSWKRQSTGLSGLGANGLAV